MSKAEAKFVFEDGCDLLIVGAGQDGNVRLSPEASAYFDKRRCRVVHPSNLMRLCHPGPNGAHSYRDLLGLAEALSENRHSFLARFE